MFAPTPGAMNEVLEFISEISKDDVSFPARKEMQINVRRSVFTDDVFGCSKNSSWSLVPSTLPPSLRYGKKNNADVQRKPWRRTEECCSLFLLSFQGYWSDGETLSQHESCPVTQLTTGSQTGLSISALLMAVFPFSTDFLTIKQSSLYVFLRLDQTSKCVGF